MHVLILSAAGMTGRKLTARLLDMGRLGKAEISRLTLHDVVMPPAPAPTAAPLPVAASASDFAEPGVVRELVATRPDIIFHRVAIVSGEAESDFEKGYRINLDGTRFLFEAIRAAGLWVQAAAGLCFFHRCFRRTLSRGHRRRVLPHAANELRHAEGPRQRKV